MAELEAEERPAEDSELLGFDVTWFSYHSVIGQGGRFFGDPSDTPQGEILSVVEDLLAPRLNSNLLFAERTDAERLVRCLVAMKRLSPDLFEDDSGFSPSVHALYRLKLEVPAGMNAL